MAEKTLEERLSELYEKIDHRDQFFDKDLKTLIDGIRDAREHGGTASVDVTPIVGGYKIVITDSEGVEHVATVKDGGDAYEVYKSTVPEGQSPMTKEEWLETLKGADGATPTINQSNKHWEINGSDTGVLAEGHNPNLGTYLDTDTKPTTGKAGDYIYVVDTSVTPRTANVWSWNGTAFADTGKSVEDFGLQFASGQPVADVHIKDENGDDDPNAQDVLSAEAGQHLNEQLNGAPSNIASNGYMDPDGTMHAITVTFYETSIFIPVSLQVDDVLEFTEGENYDVQSRLCFFEYNTPTTLDPENNIAKIYKAVNAAPRTYTITSNDSAILSSNYIRMGWKTENRDNVYIKLNGNIIYRPTVGAEGDFVRKEEFNQELGNINQNIGTKSQDSALESNNLWEAVDELDEKIEESSGSTKEKVDASGTVAGIGFNSNNNGFGQNNSFTTVYLQLKAGDEFSVSIISPDDGSGTNRFRIGYTTVVPSLEASATPADPNQGVWIAPNGEVLSGVVVQSACYVCVSCTNARVSSINFYMKKTLEDRVADCELDIEGLQEEVDGLQDSIETNEDYIRKRFIASKFANPSNQSKCFTLLHFSDIHGGVDNLTRIVAFKQQWQSYIDDAICTGDIVYDFYTDEHIFDPSATNYPDGANTILLCTGNHDTRVSGSGTSCWYSKADTEDEYNLIMGNRSNWGVIVQPSDAGQNGYYPCYYYKDYTTAGVRLIVLDMMSLGKAIYNASDSTDNLGQNAQIVWLNDVLDDAKTNSLHVVIAQHFPPITKGKSNVSPSASIIDNDFTIPNSFYEHHYGGLDEQIARRAIPYLIDLIENYITNGGTFVCWIAGHTHYDMLIKMLNNEQRMIVISAANYNASDQRTIRNTTDESMDLFNIFSVDTTNRIVKVFRIGGHLTPALQKIDTMHFTY